MALLLSFKKATTACPMKMTRPPKGKASTSMCPLAFMTKDLIFMEAKQYARCSGKAPRDHVGRRIWEQRER
eukprot:m.89865 g.89865  ORF g.89865 m.89865 type:complete len:71 (-) comp14868_c3_seq16:369-581(-)